MSNESNIDVAVGFIEKINRRDFDGLLKMMTPDHKALDEEGATTAGSEKAVNMITDYTTKWPDFQIHINDIYQKDEKIIVVGRTTGSCTEKSRGTEIQERLIYVLKVENGLVAQFQYALTDDDKTRKEVGLDSAMKIT